jgi:hypothetical protein
VRLARGLATREAWVRGLDGAPTVTDGSTLASPGSASVGFAADGACANAASKNGGMRTRVSAKGVTNLDTPPLQPALPEEKKPRLALRHTARDHATPQYFLAGIGLSSQVAT